MDVPSFGNRPNKIADSECNSTDDHDANVQMHAKQLRL
ncbi:hypothetical protein AVEN_247106-1, partial [Araneus ventricosus]